MVSSDYSDNVFINCPFDRRYKSMFDAIVFAVFDCGFIGRCALEEADASQIRLEKIFAIITDCRYAIHDISRSGLDKKNRLPRFNIPLELGLFLSAKKFGSGVQRNKKCLILDKEQYRYQKFISDISGQDIQAHDNDSEKAVVSVRNWLRIVSGRKTIPDGATIWERYQLFKSDLPGMRRDARLDRSPLIFNDYATLLTEWLKVQD